MAFIPEYAAYMLNRQKKGEDGMVAYERSKGKKPSTVAIEFGEKLLYMKKRGDKLSKIKSRWGFGIFVGFKRKSSEIIVSTLEGIRESRSVKRLAEERRWMEDTLNWVNWAPWHKYKDHEDQDGEVTEGVPVEERPLEVSRGERGKSFMLTRG